MTRLLPLMTTLMLLAACEPLGLAEDKPVDVSKLPPLSGQEIALITAGDAAKDKGNVAMAERNYLEAVAKSKGRVEAHLALAHFYADTGNVKKATEVLERAHRLQPAQPQVAYKLGKIYLTQNRITDATRVFAPALEADPDNLELLTASAIAHDMIPEHAKAQALYLRAQRANPKADLTVVRTNLAMSYILTGKAHMAVDVLKGDASKPNVDDVTRHNLALAYGVLGRDAEAKKLLKGELSETERKANVARIKAYVAEGKGR